MKLIAASSLAAVAAAGLATVVVADDDFDGSAASISYEVPEASGFAHLSTFQDGKLWDLSSAEKYSSQQVSIKQAIHSPPEFAGDKGLLLEAAAKHYGVGTVFDDAVDPNADEFAFQYEVKLQDGLQCGGAYMKLLEAPADVKELSDESGYSIMFGPDKCGATNKVHFIYRHKNPVTGKYTEHHLKDAVSTVADKETHLYGFTINAANDLEIFVDGYSKRTAQLGSAKDFDPPLLPEAEIDDPEDKKPEDWVDEATIEDPEAVKPEDWDEDAPPTIADPEATMPAEWDEDAPAEIDDPAAVIPEDWDEEEDGEFEAPKIPNPACKTGCGKWSAPQIKNPDYKGKWFPPMIDNPEYKGEWAPKRIANPGYWDAETHADALATPLSKIGGVVVEVWTMQGNMLFDNVWVGNSIDSARAFADSTFKLKAEAEEAFKKTKLANDKKKAREAILAEGGIVNQARFAIAFVSDWVEENPIGGVAGVLGAITLFFAIVYVTMLGGGSKKKKKAADAKGRAKKDDDAASNGNGVHEEDDDEEEENEEGDDDQEEEDDDEEEKEKPKARRRKTRRAD